MSSDHGDRAREAEGDGRTTATGPLREADGDGWTTATGAGSVRRQREREGVGWRGAFAAKVDKGKEGGGKSPRNSQDDTSGFIFMYTYGQIHTMTP